MLGSLPLSANMYWLRRANVNYLFGPQNYTWRDLSYEDLKSSCYPAVFTCFLCIPPFVGSFHVLLCASRKCYTTVIMNMYGNIDTLHFTKHSAPEFFLWQRHLHLENTCSTIVVFMLDGLNLKTQLLNFYEHSSHVLLMWSKKPDAVKFLKSDIGIKLCKFSK